MEGTESELLSKVVDVVQRMGEVINLNTDAILQINLFIQAIADLSFRAVEIGKHNMDAMSGYFITVSDRFEIIELMQDAQLELIEAVKDLSYLSLGLGVLNSVLIFVISIILLRRK